MFTCGFISMKVCSLRQVSGGQAPDGPRVTADELRSKLPVFDADGEEHVSGLGPGTLLVYDQRQGEQAFVKKNVPPMCPMDNPVQ